MAAFNLAPIGNGWQFFGGNTAGSNPNLPLAAGTLRTFAAGTSTPLATYSNNLGSIANAVQIVLDSTGRPPGEIWFPNGVAYKFTLNDSLGNQITSFDNLVGINDTSSIGLTEWIASNATPTYSSGTVFTTPGNTTATFQVGRRVQATVTAGIVYGTIVSSVFGVSTTVTLVMDSTVLDNGLISVNVGFLGESPPSIPASIPYPMTFGGSVSAGSLTVSGATLLSGTLTNNGVASLAGATTTISTPIFPNQIAFNASRTGPQTSGGTVIFNNFLTAQFGGTNYSTTTGVFTAPFSGLYFFSASVAVNNTSGGTLVEFIFFTVTSGGTYTAATFQTPATTATTESMSISGVYFLTAGGTISVGISGLAANNNVVGNSAQFSGCMLARTA